MIIIMQLKIQTLSGTETSFQHVQEEELEFRFHLTHSYWRFNMELNWHHAMSWMWSLKLYNSTQKSWYWYFWCSPLQKNENQSWPFPCVNGSWFLDSFQVPRMFQYEHITYLEAFLSLIKLNINGICIIWII